jgi:CxxC motif-containing protein (DUF1111 family)
MSTSKILTGGLALSLALTCPAIMSAQTDPGPRQPPTGPGPGGPGGQAPPPSGQAIRGLTAADMQAFLNGKNTFSEVETVATGLGPRFNMDNCAGCHAYPATGGASPAVNPQIEVATKNGAKNQVPPFIQSTGPVHAVRFILGPNGQPDGGVHDLFVITGRADAPAACNITQPDFSNAANLSLRIPTPPFGLGLIESITDTTLRNNLAATAAQRQALGIQGIFNTSANDGTITRFGWKAQNKSLMMFSGEAYNVEMGVTNEIFPQEREENPACATNSLPEDQMNLVTGQPSDLEMFSIFMRLLAPPQPSPANQSINNGRALFGSTGCALCHTPTLQSGNSSYPALTNQAVNLYSDLATHNMGQGLNDRVTQGQANGQDWRSAPLWGLGDRLFLLHDGRTKDLVQAILAHDSQGSEAHLVIQNYQGLSAGQKQDLLNFLRSL